jgi:multicomponent Na+:H+ antiporter subunit F
MTVNTVLIAVIAVIFAVAALLAIIRMIKGPSILDRAIASDVLLSEVLCILGAEAVINQHMYTLPIMLMISATGILGTVAVARFVALRDRAQLREDER